MPPRPEVKPIKSQLWPFHDRLAATSRDREASMLDHGIYRIFGADSRGGEARPALLQVGGIRRWKKPSTARTIAAATLARWRG